MFYSRHRPPGGVVRTVFRWMVAAAFVAAGIDHFYNPGFFQKIVPPGFPSPPLLVAISGACEILGGLGLLIRPTRRLAGWGLILLLIAVFPANVYMAVSPGSVRDLHVPHWLLWARLPLQGVFIAWVWYVAMWKKPKGFIRRRGR